MKIVKRKNKYLDPDFSKVKIRSDEKLITYPSIKKAKKLLKWRPKTSLNKGINLTNNYYKNIFKNESIR